MMIPHRIAEGSGLALINLQTGKAVGPAEIEAVQDVSIPQRALFMKHFKNGVYIPDNKSVQAVLNVKPEGGFETAAPTGQAEISSLGEDAVRAPEITVTEPIAVQWQAPAEFTFIETGPSQVFRAPLQTEPPASPEAPVVLPQTSEPGLPPLMPDDAIRQAATLPGAAPEAGPETVPAGASNTEATELDQPIAKAETTPQVTQIMAHVAQLGRPPEALPDATEPALPRTNPGGDGPAQRVADPGPLDVDSPPERANLRMATNPPMEPLPVQPDNRVAVPTALRADPAQGVSASKIEAPVVTGTKASTPPATAMPGDATETPLPVSTGAGTDAPEPANQRGVEPRMPPVDRPFPLATPTAPRSESAAMAPARMASDAGPAMPSDPPPPPAIDGEPAPQAAPMPRPESTAPAGAAPLAMAATNMGRGEPPNAAVAAAFVPPDRPRPAPAPPAAPAPLISTPAPPAPDVAGIIGNDAAITPETGLETLPRSTGHVPVGIAPNAGLSPGAAMPSPRYIAAQIAVQNAQPGTPLEIALDPPELGKVRLTLLPGDAGMTVQITAERAETIDLLRRHAGILSDEFQRQGQRDASFDFSREHSDNRPQTPAANAEWLIESDETGPAPPQTGAIHPTGPAQNLRLSGLDVRF